MQKDLGFSIEASKPRERSRSRKVDDDFSIAEDGKIIVSEESTGAESKKEDEKVRVKMKMKIKPKTF